jgi:hypothetical protein
MKKGSKTALWESRFEDYEQSGMSGRHWCAEHNVTYDTFRYWKNKLRPESIIRKGGLAPSKSKLTNSTNGTKWVESLFMPEQNASDTAEGNGSAITIACGKMQIRLTRGFDKILLGEILEALS